VIYVGDYLESYYNTNICKYYLDGTCTVGKNCTFYHPVRCINYKYENNYTCDYGNMCKFAHIKSPIYKKVDIKNNNITVQKYLINDRFLYSQF
jgi:hypothetical protein